MSLKIEKKNGKFVRRVFIGKQGDKLVWLSIPPPPLPHSLSTLSVHRTDHNPVVIIHFCSCVKHLTRSASPPLFLRSINWQPANRFGNLIKARTLPFPYSLNLFSEFTSLKESCRDLGWETHRGGLPKNIPSTYNIRITAVEVSTKRCDVNTRQI